MTTVITGCRITVLAEALLSTTANVSGISTTMSATVEIERVYALPSGVIVTTLLTG